MDITIFYYFLVFVGGLFIGSFLNVVSFRLENGGSIVYGRSRCDACLHELGWKELIPVVSYVLQRGKCKACGVKMGLGYPLSEVLTGSIFVAIAIWLQMFSVSPRSGFVTFLFLLLISSMLVVIFISDLRYMIVPDVVVIPASVISVVYQLGVASYFAYTFYKELDKTEFGKTLIQVGYWKTHVLNVYQQLGVSLLSGLGVSLFFLLLIALTKGRGMGFGDVKLGFLIGFLNSFPNSIIAIFSAFFLGSLVSLALVVARRKSIKDAVPFGPFLIIGFYIALFFGSSLFSFYLKMLN